MVRGHPLDKALRTAPQDFFASHSQHNATLCSDLKVPFAPDEPHVRIFLMELCVVELYVPPLPTSAPSSTYRTRNEVFGGSGGGQGRGSGKKALGKHKTSAIGRVTTPALGDKLFGARADDEEEPDYIEPSTDPGTRVSDWGDFESGSPTFGNAGLTTLISLHICHFRSISSRVIL